MKIRAAKVQDVNAIHALISSHAELDKMLFRSIADIYENIQIFKVAESDDNPGRILGCCALRVVWEDLAEIKSLAVDENFMGRGIGKMLIEAILAEAAQLGLKKIFTLTLEPAFFEKANFKLVPKESLPMKVWSDCAKCPKQDNCDEIALIYEAAK